LFPLIFPAHLSDILYCERLSSQPRFSRAKLAPTVKVFQQQVSAGEFAFAPRANEQVNRLTELFPKFRNNFILRASAH
jgi:hypothetical protein